MSGVPCCRFMLDDMLSLQGNTAVYLLYAHARIAAIGRKAGIDNIAALAHDHPVQVDHEKERNLAMHVSPPPYTLLLCPLGCAHSCLMQPWVIR